MAPIPRLKPYAGPALFSYGFRPFFLVGALYAALAIPLWLLVFSGRLELGTAFAPRDWHVHEMLYGYVPAVMTGFLLTAIPNWTGRLPLQGAPLLVLLFAWIAGRSAVALSGTIGWAAAAAIDCAFLLLVATAAAREILAGGNWRNLKVVTLVAVLAGANIAFHIEAHVSGVADYSIRLGLAAVVMLITLIGGRIVPSFTRNWLARENPGRLPAPFGKFDAVIVAATAAALLLWVALPEMPATGWMSLVAGLLQAVRLARWAGDRTWREPLVLILHIGYGFVPLGFLLTGLVSLALVPAAAGIHAFAGGAVGTMTLAVMTRASLGHTGHALHASFVTQAIYAAVVLSALARICAALRPDEAVALLALSGALWLLAFAGFTLAYGPVLASRRLQSA
ncbi:MAG TPA: NnrS family protein [Xanthobacteraceae bacterium]|jgi:uncharacterized protein involved in response to NO|nr:NnrS family protein [Xanthobacteraceae bacterium]